MRDDAITWIGTAVWLVFGGYHAYRATHTTAGVRLGYAVLAVVGLVLAGYWGSQSLQPRRDRTG